MSGPLGRDETRHAPRSRPEWVTFGVAAMILLFVIGALVSLALRPSDPAAPVAERNGQVRKVGDRYFIAVDVVNTGDEAAAQIQVTAELVVGDATTTGDQVIDFLGGGEVQSLTFVFEDDPADGELSISVAAFAAP